MEVSGQPDGRGVERSASRKVRTPQGRLPGNTRGGDPPGEPAGQGHRNIPPVRARVKRWCKRPPALPKCSGQVTPNRSKAKQGPCPLRRRETARFLMSPG